MLPRINLIQTDIGQFLTFSTKDFISNYLIDYGTWEPWTLKVTRFLLADVPSPTVYDIGANMGAYSVPVANMVATNGGMVHAFEAQRIVYHQLCGNTFLNRLSNVYTYNLALNFEEGEISVPIIDYAKNTNVGALSLNAEIRTGRQEVPPTVFEQVKAVTLDSFAQTPLKTGCALIKIDVEGMELEVIRGAFKFLETHQFPPVIFEVWSDNHYPWYRAKKEELFAKFKKMGYEYLVTGEMAIAQHSAYPHVKNMPELKALLGLTS